MKYFSTTIRSKFATVGGAFLLATSLVFAPTANARELSVAIKGTNMPAWTSGDECRSKSPYYGAQTCDNFFGDACSAYGYEIWTSESSFDSIYSAVIERGQTAYFIELNNGSFGDTVCELSKK